MVVAWIAEQTTHNTTSSAPTYGTRRSAWRVTCMAPAFGKQGNIYILAEKMDHGKRKSVFLKQQKRKNSVIHYSTTLFPPRNGKDDTGALRCDRVRKMCMLTISVRKRRSQGSQGFRTCHRLFYTLHLLFSFLHLILPSLLSTLKLPRCAQRRRRIPS